MLWTFTDGLLHRGKYCYQFFSVEYYEHFISLVSKGRREIKPDKNTALSRDILLLSPLLQHIFPKLVLWGVRRNRTKRATYFTAVYDRKVDITEPIKVE